MIFAIMKSIIDLILVIVVIINALIITFLFASSSIIDITFVIVS